MAKQPSLGHRAEGHTCAALIPIRKKKTPLMVGTGLQDERRKIFEEQSRHIYIGLQPSPPAVACKVVSTIVGTSRSEPLP